MDIFVRNVPLQATKKQLERHFTAPLGQCGVTCFHAEKFRDKPLAILTVLDVDGGARFLEEFGVPQGSFNNVRAKRQLSWNGKFLTCSRSRNDPTVHSVRSLALEASQQAAKATAVSASKSTQGTRVTKFSISRIRCGVWEYVGKQLSFQTHYSRDVPGTITFGQKEAIVLLGPREGDQTRLDLKYYDCESILIGSHGDSNVSFTLRFAPKFYEVAALDILSAQMTAMALGRDAGRRKGVKKRRLLSLDSDHAKIASTCFVYRIQLSDPGMLGNVRSLLRNDPQKPTTLSFYVSTTFPREPWRRSKERLDIELSDPQRFGKNSFRLRFQLDRLARNGLLPPLLVIKLLPKISRLQQEYGLGATLWALGHFSKLSPYPSPETKAEEVTHKALEQLLEELATSYDPASPQNPYELAKRHAHVSLVHRIVVTPVGTYLEGPEPEPTNRVLRQYPEHTDSFARVVFQDEDGGLVRYDPRSTQQLVYHQRFKQVLDGTILIAGQGFSFLGFSHSSLRSQSCWFMAPLFENGLMQYAPQVLKRLGDFSKIRSPPRCAARIGQCFTDTAVTVNLTQEDVGSSPVVERNGRDFSDGCGTISQDLLRMVWRTYGTKRSLKPTILQIRFQGAKGVVSLDTRLTGHQLRLRENMKKFQGSQSWDLEICGAAFRPLPMTLNRQFIKILEDLGIPKQVFLDLQQDAVNKLLCMTTSAVNTATLLEEIENTKATKIPSLINLLDEIGLD
ncbi:hypothetical protein B0A50_04053 [Salinomyces thailandicus]|uniref:RNA-dependent RNA polymerase n=1 Tax=Salinomyces thailandicus TaxID=706561 RepID=A0A4U0TZR5_9PEZI|nr:hypothetical protein B0A50_04053 [Salinomyces thailandica]